MISFRYLWYITLIISLLSCSKGRITMIALEPDSPRLQHGAEKLAGTLSGAGYKIYQPDKPALPGKGKTIVIGELDNQLINFVSSRVFIKADEISRKEGYIIRSDKNIYVIGGCDHSGTLYGCLELAERVKKSGRLPDEINISDKPEMVLRGACIGLQKPTWLPGRNVYEYPDKQKN